MLNAPSSPRPRGFAGSSSSGPSVKPEGSSNQSGAGKRNFYSQPLPSDDPIGHFGAPSSIQTFQSMTAPLDPRMVVQVSINAVLDEFEKKEREKKASPPLQSLDHQRVDAIPSGNPNPQQG